MRSTKITTVTTVTVNADGEQSTESNTEAVQLFSFDALDDNAQARVIAELTERYARSTESDDIHGTVCETFAYALAEDAAGEGSRPDLEAMVVGWDITRGARVDLQGTLTPDNAPKLPWPEQTEEQAEDFGELYISLGDHAYFSSVVVHGLPDDSDAARALEQAVRDAQSAALEAGRAQDEYLSSEGRAREELEGDDTPMYSADGDNLY